MVEGGLGRLIADWGRDVPVRLGHAVSRIAWDDAGAVTVSGDWGSATARTAIVTVPTGVLRDGRIRFVPELPNRTLAAIEALPMGRFTKIGLRLDALLRDVPEYAFDIARANRGEAVGLHVHPSLPLVTAIVAGDHARDVARMPEKDRMAHVTEALRDAFGATHPAIVAHDHHDWSADPFALGAYSVRMLGADEARTDYARPVADRLFLAGDAAQEPHPISVGAAHDAGAKAARAVLSQ